MGWNVLHVFSIVLIFIQISECNTGFEDCFGLGWYNACQDYTVGMPCCGVGPPSSCQNGCKSCKGGCRPKLSEYTVTVYEHANHKGKSWDVSLSYGSKLNIGCKNLPDAAVNSGITSINTYGRCAVLFDKKDCNLKPDLTMGFFPGDEFYHFDFRKIHGLNDNVRSIAMCHPYYKE